MGDPNTPAAPWVKMATASGVSDTAVARSVRLSPFRSAATIPPGRCPPPTESVRVCANTPLVLVRMPTVPSSWLETARSVSPSPSKSPAATARGASPTRMLADASTPALLRMMLTVLSSRFAVAKSGSASPSRSTAMTPRASPADRRARPGGEHAGPVVDVDAECVDVLQDGDEIQVMVPVHIRGRQAVGMCPRPPSGG